MTGLLGGAVGFRTTMYLGRRAALVATLLAPSAVAGQQAGVAGIVRDATSGAVLEAVDVSVGNGVIRRSARTDASGRFSLAQLDTGTVTLIARKLGYGEFRLQLHLGINDTAVEIGLTPLARRLPRVTINGAGPGFFGAVFALKDMLVLPSARIDVVGAPKGVVTDSAGRFVIALAKPGRYLLRVSHTGYADRTMWMDAVTDSLTDASAALDPATIRHPDDDVLWSEFDRRVKWARLSSALVPGEELRRYGTPSLTDALRTAPAAVERGLRVGATTCVFINGRPKPGLPLDAIAVEEVQAVELYGSDGDGSGILAREWPGGRCGESSTLTGPSLADPSTIARFAVVWLR